MNVSVGMLQIVHPLPFVETVLLAPPPSSVLEMRRCMHASLRTYFLSTCKTYNIHTHFLEVNTSTLPCPAIHHKVKEQIANITKWQIALIV